MGNSTSDKILSQLRTTNEPAMSAADLSESLDVSVKTINTYLEDLIQREEIETTQIGNARAYYLPRSKQSLNQNPEYTCYRCGRNCPKSRDLVKIEFDGYSKFGNRDFMITCRFCIVDLGRWLKGDEAAIGEYPSVHSWDIPQDQLETVREDPDIVTAPDEPVESNETLKEAYEIMHKLAAEGGEALSQDDLQSSLQEELGSYDGKRMYRRLSREGHFAAIDDSDKLLVAK